MMTNTLFFICIKIEQMGFPDKNAESEEVGTAINPVF
ncbi:MAG: hypothetical protein ACJA1Z_003414 [Patiriisocius sp.]|jgi:hypothetical protein